jgi:5-methyltetrahydropteroyltriglutamate--homocysteine methyltransferase
MERILTTHTGSLPRPDDLSRMLLARSEGETTPELEARTRSAVAEIVRRQREAGVDIVNDGEQGKEGYATYVKERLTGFDGESEYPTRRPEMDDFPDFAERWRSFRGATRIHVPACTGDIRVRDETAVQTDIANLKAAARDAGVDAANVFMTAASPGVVGHFFEDHHYGSRDEFLAAIADAMRSEYRAIADAGIMLQLDCPDLAMSRHSKFAGMSLDEFRREVARNVEALNHAVQDIPAERMRMHLCWGNYEGPHTHDVELNDILDLVLQARPAGISIEASNPRHGHEWEVFERIPLPDGRYVIPGVVDSTTNFVEHPRLIAQRLLNFARVVGAERVQAGSDCGFGTFVGMATVAPSITWAKLGAMAEGARIATEQLEGSRAS